jgi:hypothetical protein
MMKRLLPMLMLAMLFAGCQTTLDSGGPYGDDKILFRAEQAIVETADAMDTFLKWEHDNQVILASRPEIKKYADVVRVDGRVWIESAMALRDTYKANPTTDNKAKLQTSIALLRTMLSEIAIHMARQTATATPNR